MNENIWSVYMHINKVNGKKYIGITSQDPERRWGSDGNKYQKSVFKNAIKKYGWDNFQHEVIFRSLSEEDAKYLERLFIKCFDTKIPNGYNMTDGGDGTVGLSPSEEVRTKMSVASKTKWEDPAFRAKMTALRNDCNGAYQSEEFRNKISMLVSGEKNPNFNHKWTDEMKQSLREKQKNNPMYQNETNPNAKKIRCIETGEVFNCMKYAQERFELKSTGSFTAAIKKGKTAAGYHWEYV